MSKGWIKDSGMENEGNLPALVKQFLSGDRIFLAYSTDSFQAGYAKGEILDKLVSAKLLELRIFSEEQEISFRRSFIGELFQWRIASEKDVPESCYIVQYQTLDINRDRVEKEGNPRDQYGNCILYTTGGGKYSLPVETDVNSAKVIAYIDYDRNGMAKIVDYRLCGFLRRDVETEIQ